MKQLITIILFLGFLLIRSGNSHELINYSDRPTISFMDQQNHIHHTNQIHFSSEYHYTQQHGSGSTNNNDQVVMDHDMEDFQMWKDYHLQMALFAGIICFYFLRLLPDSLPQRLAIHKHLQQTQPIFISQRSLRI